MRLSSVLTALALALSSVLSLSPREATAQGFHEYSIARNTAYAYAQTGVLTVRPDSAITVSYSDCGSSPTESGGPVVYQTEWVIATESASNWLELGTGHRGTCRFHFWGYGENAAWHPYGWEFISVPSNPLYFDIHRLFGNWEFNIQGVNKWNLGQGASSWAGVRVESGLESYDASAVAPYANYDQLQYTIAEGPWNYFPSGSTVAVLFPDMCGGWTYFPTSWSAGQHVC